MYLKIDNTDHHNIFSDGTPMYYSIYHWKAFSLLKYISFTIDSCLYYYKNFFKR